VRTQPLLAPSSKRAIYSRTRTTAHAHAPPHTHTTQGGLDRDDRAGPTPSDGRPCRGGWVVGLGPFHVALVQPLCAAHQLGQRQARGQRSLCPAHCFAHGFYIASYHHMSHTHAPHAPHTHDTTRRADVWVRGLATQGPVTCQLSVDRQRATTLPHDLSISMASVHWQDVFELYALLPLQLRSSPLCRVCVCVCVCVCVVWLTCAHSPPALI